MWLLHFFMRHSTEAALNILHSALVQVAQAPKRSYKTSHYEAVNYLLETCVKDDVIAEMVADMMHFIHPSNKSPTKYAEAFLNWVVRFHRVYNE